MNRADVVAVLEDAAQHGTGKAIHAQVQGRLGQRPQDAGDGLIDEVINTIDDLLDEPAVVLAAWVTGSCRWRSSRSAMASGLSGSLTNRATKECLLRYLSMACSTSGQ